MDIHDDTLSEAKAFYQARKKAEKSSHPTTTESKRADDYGKSQSRPKGMKRYVAKTHKDNLHNKQHQQTMKDAATSAGTIEHEQHVIKSQQLKEREYEKKVEIHIKNVLKNNVERFVKAKELENLRFDKGIARHQLTKTPKDSTHEKRKNNH